MVLTENFHINEFACNDGTPVPEEYLDNVKKLAENLQVLRDEIERPILVNSGYRTLAWNDKVGGSLRSQHLTASAADIVINGMSPVDLKHKIQELIKRGKMKEGGIGLYHSFVHYDIRGNKARW